MPATISVHDLPPSRVRKMCGRRSSRWNVLTAAYATFASECDASMIETFAHGPISGGVTFFQLLPLSRVTWIRPSSVPAQMVLLSTGLGAMVYTTPRRDGRRRRRADVLADVLRHLPRLAAEVGADALPVRRPRRSSATRGSRRGRACADWSARRAPAPCARGGRACPVLRRAPPRPPPAFGPTGCTCPVRRLKRVDRCAAVDEVGVERIGRGVAVLVHAHRVELAIADRAVVAAARHAPRARVLLSAAQPVRERVVRRDVIERRRRLVVPRAPRLARRSP